MCEDLDPWRLAMALLEGTQGPDLGLAFSSSTGQGALPSGAEVGSKARQGGSD